jgi:hypothetical protein
VAQTDGRRAGLTIWAAAITFGIAARTVALGRWPGLNGDEAWYGVNAQELLAGGAPFLHTGVGNPLNPIHSGLLVALSTVFDPSPAVLRVPEVILGIFAVVIAFPLLAGPLGRRAALLTAVFLALSPVAVVYSRLGWDPSGSPLVTLVAIGCALHDKPVLAMFSFAVAYLVHPTNIFVAPAVAAAWAPHAIARYRQATDGQRARLVRAAAASAIIAIPIGVWALVRIAGNPDTPLPSVSMVIDRLFSPALWLGRMWGAAGLLSGITSVVYVGGPLSLPVVEGAAGIGAAALLLPVAFGRRALRQHRHAVWLLVGVVVTFAGFHVVAVPAALTPGLERYALFLLVPLVIVTAVAIDAWISTQRIAGLLGAAMFAAAMAAVQIGGYFVPLATRGGGSAATYRTGAVEPKLAAFEFIAAESGGGPITVIAEDWWLYWSLRYFAGANGRIHVEPARSASIPGGTHPAGAIVRPPPPPARTFVVAFAGSEFPSTLTRAEPLFTAVDPVNRPILHVFSVP